MYILSNFACHIKYCEYFAHNFAVIPIANIVTPMSNKIDNVAVSVLCLQPAKLLCNETYPIFS